MAAQKKKKDMSTSKKLRSGDTVIVNAGNYKGQTGTILRKDKNKVTVQGINLRKKHMKKSQDNPQGSIIDIERPIHISNVQLAVNDKAVKLKIKTDANDSRSLSYKLEGKEVSYREIRKSPA